MTAASTDRKRRWRYGSRPYLVGGRLHEFKLTDATCVSFARAYDYIEDLHYALRPTLVLVTSRAAFGFIRGHDYVRLYLGFGDLMIGWAEDPGYFEETYEEDDAEERRAT